MRYLKLQDLSGRFALKGFFVALLFSLSSCGEGPQFEYMTHNVQGHQFKVPSAYIPDGVYYSSDDVSIGWILLGAYLPDMRPWRRDMVKWKDPRDPDRVRIHVKENTHNDWNQVVGIRLESSTGYFGKYKDTGWENYGFNMGPPKHGPDSYLLINPDGVNGTSLTICDYEARVPNPSCRASFHLSPHLHVNFYFLQVRMDEWADIERKVYDLVHGFEIAAEETIDAHPD